MKSQLLNPLLLGIIGGMIPGPVLSAIFTKILQSGFSKSLRLIFSALVIETSLALANLLAFSITPLDEKYFYMMTSVGALVLLWISRSLLRINKIDSEDQVSFSFSKIALLTVTNGLFWVFETTVCVPKAMVLDKLLPFGKYFFLGTFELGWLIGTIFIAFSFSRFRSLLIKPKIIGYVFKVFAFTFVYFAIDMVYKSYKFFVF